ncbi:hypothetical protein RchiOBHm_Chr2g0113051 [Rosa chinensis]|uniref:Uncharacterized protein n=1 Tax=Rosa chinensis TaxID=74649 RepID=A0A2P6RQD6_ROSCH|nr:hypothetical protein RchiOBHm_Chr2g0113051 [Rosa chinensis]
MVNLSPELQFCYILMRRVCAAVQIAVLATLFNLQFFLQAKL